MSRGFMYQCFPEVIWIDAWECQGKQREQMSPSFQVPAGDHEERQFTVSPPMTHALSYTQPCPAISLTVWKNGRGGLGAFIMSMFISPTERMWTSHSVSVWNSSPRRDSTRKTLRLVGTTSPPSTQAFDPPVSENFFCLLYIKTWTVGRSGGEGSAYDVKLCLSHTWQYLPSSSSIQ